ncbi:uncharacterized protein DNG_04728 [Cephalotrichum gorgonifer]|uniref:Uncharacterized protein n=1 Tax=Cephalotrichum gorgonifer TaxID=2041049 RepID=A0AAE8SUU2_9PEZI|nr:uncharacterized protein DNG_04728 [Cephalotrichum gorgonifer]
MKTSATLARLAVFGFAAAAPVEQRDEAAPADTALYLCYLGSDNCKRADAGAAQGKTDGVTPA